MALKIMVRRRKRLYLSTYSVRCSFSNPDEVLFVRRSLKTVEFSHREMKFGRETGLFRKGRWLLRVRFDWRCFLRDSLCR